MLGVCQKYSGHPFSKIPILSSPRRQDLVNDHLTLESNDHVPVVTGIPLHIEQLCHPKELKKHCIKVKAVVKSFNETIEESISNAIDEKVKESGGKGSMHLFKILGFKS